MKLRDTGLLNTRLSIDTDWQAAIRDAVTPTNAVQAAALHYAVVTGVVPIGLKPGTKQPMRTGTSGYLVLPEADVVIEEIRLLTEHHNIGLRPTAGVVAIDIDTYNKNGHTKNGHQQLTQIEAIRGALPPTWSSSRRTYNPDSRSGIYYYKLPDRITHWYTRRDRYPKFVSKVTSNIEIVQMTHRSAAVPPSVADGLTYTWTRPDGTTEPGLLPPSFAGLPELPGPWIKRLVENLKGTASIRSLNAGRRPGEHYTTPTNDEDAERAEQWCADHIDGWNDAPDAYMQSRIDNVLAGFATGDSRYDTMRDGIWHLLHLAIGNTQYPGHPGGNDAVDQITDTYIDAINNDPSPNPSRNPHGDAARIFSNAVDKISDRIETGDLIPLPQTDFRFKPGGRP
ncbi:MULTISPECIES: bifunctional DNA primase/polymerase [Actinomycetes]|uniref:bifunctional DNA primase/polymerase n=1 Tax=Actinomycetes TaxID=1760 RepID=UPI0004BEC1C0|nr:MULTISPECIES: bifunctional DNA primase/polymerase [Actinomycetes]